jgi:outer membrane receptor protein involved in Fe transport
VGLATRKQFESEVLYTHFDSANLQDLQSAQTVDQDSGETILRGTLTRALGRGRLEAGGEVALNTLDGTSDLTEDTGGGAVTVDVPNADISVEEKRGEAFVAYATPLSTHWSFDARLAAEYSRLDFTGDSDLSEKLTYVKPRAQVTRKLGPHQVQFRVYRDVGQLDFTDFVSTAQLADGVIAGGNPELRPQSAWAVELDTDLRFPGDAALRVRLFQHYLDDVVDFVPVGDPGDQFDAPGNIGEGTLSGVQMSLRLPLKPVLPGGTLSVNATLQDSDVTDPTTGAERDISEFIEDEVTAELRQDLPDLKFAWGLGFESFGPDTDYKLREVDSFRQLRFFSAFVETTVIPGFKLKLLAESINSDTEKRDRRFYDPDRNGSMVLRELSHFRPGTWWTLTLSGKF